MRQNIKISKIDKKRNKLFKKIKFLIKKSCISYISFGQMSQNEST